MTNPSAVAADVAAIDNRKAVIDSARDAMVQGDPQGQRDDRRRMRRVARHRRSQRSLTMPLATNCNPKLRQSLSRQALPGMICRTIGQRHRHFRADRHNLAGFRNGKHWRCQRGRRGRVPRRPFDVGAVYSTVTEVRMPPRGVKSATSFIDRGIDTATRSSRMRLLMCS